MVFEGFCGASYQSSSKYAAIERCVNFFPEAIESPDEKKAKVVLYPTPCTTQYAPYDLAIQKPSRGLLDVNGLLYGVNGDTLFVSRTPDLSAPQILGTVQNSSSNPPVQMIANGVTTAAQQVFISSFDQGYISSPQGGLVDLSTVPGFLAGRGAAFLDDYFISLIPFTNGFQISAINDGTKWDPADIAYTQGQSDELVNLIADREYLWLFGSRRSEIWYNQGGQFFPFAIQPGAFLEIGLQAANSLVQADNSLFWLGSDKRGGFSAWRANGLTPIRITTHAIEAIWSKYPAVDDCVAYALLWKGHTFIRFIFPTAQAGWTYDCAASRILGYSVWHENTYTDNNGKTYAPLERCHAFFDNVHVVGSGGVDGFPGRLYQFTDLTSLPANPVLLLRLSRDGGNTYGPEYQLAVGQIGEYEVRCLKNMLGAARDLVVWVRCVDFGDANGASPIVRDRICPHQYKENVRVFYNRLEIELNKAIGSAGGNTEAFWALINAYLTIVEGVI